LITTDYFHGQTIYRADVAATGPAAPVPPGIPRDPGPGQYYVSPALSALLRSAPAGELADRYPGPQAGLIGAAGPPAPPPPGPRRREVAPPAGHGGGPQPKPPPAQRLRK